MMVEVVRKRTRGIAYGRPLPQGERLERYKLPPRQIKTVPQGMTFDVLVLGGMDIVWRLIRDAGLADECCARHIDGLGDPFSDDTSIDRAAVWQITCRTENQKLRIERQAKLNCVRIAVRQRPAWA